MHVASFGAAPASCSLAAPQPLTRPPICSCSINVWAVHRGSGVLLKSCGPPAGPAPPKASQKSPVGKTPSYQPQPEGQLRESVSAMFVSAAYSLRRWAAARGAQQLQLPPTSGVWAAASGEPVGGGRASTPFELPSTSGSRGYAGDASGDDVEALLASLVNYEQQGIPAAAGTTASNRFDLSRMRRLLQALGDPQNRLAAVHIAGSKGKCCQSSSPRLFRAPITKWADNCKRQ